MSQRKIMKVSLGIVVLGAMGYVGLGFWQLGQVDQLRQDMLVRQVGLLEVDCGVFKEGFWSRDVYLNLGLAKAFGGEKPFLEMKGAFAPGFRPSIVLNAVEQEDPQTKIFSQAKPQIILYFDYAMRPTQMDVKWDSVTIDEETLGSGKITADFTVDSSNRQIQAITVHGKTQDSHTKFEDEDVIIGGVNFQYQFSSAPMLFQFFMRGQGDKGLHSLAPVSIGPFRYRFLSRHKIIGQEEKTQSDFGFDVKDFSIRDDFLPPLHIQYEGSFLTSKEVWLPCLGSRIWLGEAAVSSLEFLPGICPREVASDTLDMLQKEGIEGKDQKFFARWTGGKLSLTGQFQAQQTFAGQFDLVTTLDPRAQPTTSTLSKQFTLDVQRYLDGLVQEGVMEKTRDHTYKMTLAIHLNENFDLSIQGNGIDLRTVQTEFTANHPSTNPYVMIISAIPIDEYYKGSGMQDFLRSLRSVLATIRGIQWTKEWTDRNRYTIHIFVQEGTDLKELNALLDRELSRIVNRLPKGIEVEMQSNAQAVLGESE